MKVAVTAMWAGFGPTAKAVTVAHELDRRGHRVYWMLAGNQAELLDDKRRLTLDNPSREFCAQRWLKAVQPDILVSFATHVPLLAAKKLNIKSVVVESVGWRVNIPRKDGLKEAYARANAVCFQRFGDWPGAGLANERLVDAIVDMRGEADGDSGVILHLGGLRRHGALLGKTTHWLVEVAGAINESTMKHRLTVTGDDFALAHVDWPISTRSRQRSRLEYLNLLAGARVLVTVPGLTGIIEGYAYSVPVAVMPSPKREHKGNLVKLLNHGLLAMAQFADAASALKWALDAPAGSLKRLVDEQNVIIRKWGLKGAAQVADVIEEVGDA